MPRVHFSTTSDPIDQQTIHNTACGIFLCYRPLIMWCSHVDVAACVMQSAAFLNWKGGMLFSISMTQSDLYATLWWPKLQHFLCKAKATLISYFTSCSLYKRKVHYKRAKIKLFSGLVKKMRHSLLGLKLYASTRTQMLLAMLDFTLRYEISQNPSILQTNYPL